jgi:cell wall-associated protease
MNKTFLILILIIVSCKTKKLNHSDHAIIVNDSLFWHYKDFSIDSIPGISLDKWYSENEDKKTKQKQIIVAVVDTHLDVYHEDLKNQIWVNKKEIPNNNIDDDKNGYVDDVNGWNFIGNIDGTVDNWTNFDYVRIIRKYSKFEGLEEKNINVDDIDNYNNYKQAKQYHTKQVRYYTNWLKSINHLLSVYIETQDTLKNIFGNDTYNLKQLDSLYNLKKINDKDYIERRNSNDKDLGALIDYQIIMRSSNYNFETLKKSQRNFENRLEKNLNLEFKDREKIKDDSKFYGTNKVYNDSLYSINALAHNTKVSSVIASEIGNKKGINGFHKNIKIMPIVTSTSGDEHDRDIANAIYYAVNNGAKVINMSFGKEFSLNQNIVNDAMRYAEKNNVIIIHACGNSNANLDLIKGYPVDVVNDVEIVNNFISVASSNQNLNINLVSSFSNYGKKNVDIFAPGNDIYCATSKNKYEVDGGTSLAAPMVSGTAALIWLYYPKLNVKQVKEIILESSTKYDIEVLVPGTTDKKVKFSELSKSGGVLNVYNAMELAKRLSQQKEK